MTAIPVAVFPLVCLLLLTLCSTFIDASSFNISCYVCDSTGSRKHLCDPIDQNENIVRCSTLVDPNKPQSCRKIVQTVVGKRRVIRQCSNVNTEEDMTCVDRVGTDQVKVKYCHCRGSYCNHAATRSGSGGLMLSFLAAAIAARVL